MYSDQPPPPFKDRQLTDHGGHAKGVLAWKGDQGFYMPHSLPRFPSLDGKNCRSSIENGQLFMCITLRDTTKITKVIEYIKGLQPNIYTGIYNRPFFDSIQKQRGIVSLETGSLDFDLILRKKEKEDIWSKTIREKYGQSLYVQTWRNGCGTRLNSICSNNKNGILTVEDILYLQYVSNNGRTVSYDSRTTQEHGKWAVGKDFDSVFCFGDLNRMKSQVNRNGGGAICFRNAHVSKNFRKLVKETECKDSTVNGWKNEWPPKQHVCRGWDEVECEKRKKEKNKSGGSKRKYDDKDDDCDDDDD